MQTEGEMDRWSGVSRRWEPEEDGGGDRDAKDETESTAVDLLPIELRTGVRGGSDRWDADEPLHSARERHPS